MFKPVVVAASLAILAGCAAKPAAPGTGTRTGAEDAITAAGLLAHITTLSSDKFEGRAPGTEGERLAVDYLVTQFKQLGLKPGNPDGGYTQDVPLVGITGKVGATLTASGKRMHMKLPDDFVANSRRFVADVKVKNSPLVFVGYGVVAPEYGWDDYKGVDVRGKTLVMLINDPPVKDPADPTKLDDKVFHGKAMTYYGRWTYKFEIGSEKGAAAVLIVHETGPAGYPWHVVSSSWGQEEFDIDAPGGNAARVPVEGWITEERASKLFELTGHSLAEMKRAAASRDFKPVALPAKASFTVHNTLRRVQSKNVVAKLEGTERKDEYVIHTAHWDHLGRDLRKQGDQIYNGAVDNASGCAGLLELARAYTKLPAAPRRSVLFVAVTSEEKGLLGSQWYAEHPLYPLAKTAAEFNLDGVNPWGRTRDLVIVGKGQSTLEDLLADAIARQGRVLIPDPEPEKGFYYRSDQFEFAKVGVPALFINPGVDYVGHSADYGRKRREDFTAHDYHQVTDEVKPDWDLAGAVQDLQALFEASVGAANAEEFPEWKAGSEFKARREAMLK